MTKVLDNLQKAFKKHLKKKMQDKKFLDNLRNEAEKEMKLDLEKQFEKDSLEVAKVKAKRDTINLLGLKKLKGLSRADRLTDFNFNNFSEYTKRNLERTKHNYELIAKLKQGRKK